jgi:hypothetical protein
MGCIVSNPVRFNSTIDFASMISRGDLEVSVDIPATFSIPAPTGGTLPYVDFTKSVRAPNADSLYCSWKSSKINRWLVGHDASTFDPVSAIGGSCFITVEPNQITMHVMYANPYNESVVIKNGQTITANVIFFDQPL